MNDLIISDNEWGWKTHWPISSDTNNKDENIFQYKDWNDNNDK